MIRLCVRAWSTTSWQAGLILWKNSGGMRISANWTMMAGLIFIISLNGITSSQVFDTGKLLITWKFIACWQFCWHLNPLCLLVFQLLFNRCQQEHSKNFSIVFWKIKKRPVKSFKPHVDTYVVSVPINFRQGQRQSSLCRAQERKEIDDYGENDEYKSRKKHIYKEDRADSIYCPLLFHRRGKRNHAGKD